MNIHVELLFRFGPFKFLFGLVQGSPMHLWRKQTAGPFDSSVPALSHLIDMDGCVAKHETTSPAASRAVQPPQHHVTSVAQCHVADHCSSTLGSPVTMPRSPYVPLPYLGPPYAFSPSSTAEKEKEKGTNCICFSFLSSYFSWSNFPSNKIYLFFLHVQIEFLFQFL